MNLEFGSRCLIFPFASGTRSETLDWRASKGRRRFSSLQRRTITSTIQIFPIHRQDTTSSLPATVESEWLQLHTPTLISSDLFSAETASATVAVAGNDLSGGFPTHKSETCAARKLRAIQIESKSGERKRKSKKRWDSYGGRRRRGLSIFRRL